MTQIVVIILCNKNKYALCHTNMASAFYQTVIVVDDNDTLYVISGPCTSILCDWITSVSELACSLPLIKLVCHEVGKRYTTCIYDVYSAF